MERRTKRVKNNKKSKTRVKVGIKFWTHVHVAVDNLDFITEVIVL